jgi:hypothetical protein
VRHAPPFFPDERVIGETHTYLRLRRKLRFHIHLLRILNSVAEFLSGTDGIESDSEEEDLELVLETLLEGVRRQRRMSGTPPRADVSNGQEPRETLIRFLVARFTAGLRVAIPVVEEFPSQSELDAAYDVGTSLGRAVRERHRGRLEDGLNAALGQGLHSSSSGEQQQPQQPEGVSEPEPTPGVAQQTAGPASDEALFSLGGVPTVLPAPKAKPKPKAKVVPTSPTPNPVNPNDDPPNPSTVPVPPSFPLNVNGVVIPVALEGAVGKKTVSNWAQFWLFQSCSGRPGGPEYPAGSQFYAGFRPEEGKRIFYGPWHRVFAQAADSRFRARGFGDSLQGELDARVWLQTFGDDTGAFGPTIYC